MSARFVQSDTEIMYGSAYEDEQNSTAANNEKHSHLLGDGSSVQPVSTPPSAKSLFTSFRQKLRQNPTLLRPSSVNDGANGEDNVETRGTVATAASDSRDSKPGTRPQSQGMQIDRYNIGLPKEGSCSDTRK